MPYNIQLRQVDPMPLAAAGGHGQAQTYIEQLFTLLDEVWSFLNANPQITHLGHNVFLYWNAPTHDLLSTDQGLPIQAGVLVTTPFVGKGNVIFSTTPGGTAAMVVHTGPYEHLSAAHAAVRDWCHDHHHLLAGPNWEIYGDWNAGPTQLWTEVWYLLS